MVERSGPTGRGGAGFPTGRKMRSVASRRGPAVVIANGAEGEPASGKDRLLLTRLPHLVLDGISLAAQAVGAREAHLVVHRQDGWLRDRLQAAADARYEAGADPVPIQVTGIPGRYVSSEQTAVAAFLGGGPGKPAFTPPRLDERGLRGRPTLENNVETLAHLALIARYGDGWFRSIGLPSATGSALVTVGGTVGLPGIYEIELGTRIGDVLDAGRRPHRAAAGRPGRRVLRRLDAGGAGLGAAAEPAHAAGGGRRDGRRHPDRPAGDLMRPGRDGPGGPLSRGGDRGRVRAVRSACPPWPTRWPTWRTTVAAAGRWSRSAGCSRSSRAAAPAATRTGHPAGAQRAAHVRRGCPAA